MALRDQPYLPLYVQDFLTDEKLNLCSYETQGVFIKIMCILHKQETYGKLVLNENDKILFKQNVKQNSSRCLIFAFMFSKLLPIPIDILERALEELIGRGVMCISDDEIAQKRMVRDGQISEARSNAGKKGGGNPNLFKQNPKQNPEIENEYEIENKVVTKYKYAGENFDLSFINPAYQKCFQAWIKFRQSGAKPFRMQMEVEAAYTELLYLSGNNPETAEQIVNRSISNGYQSLLELKSKACNNRAPTRSDIHGVATSEEHLKCQLK